MEMIINLLMGAGALGAGFYCLILSRRLQALNGLEGGMGGAIAVLSAQVDDMTKALQAAQTTAGASHNALTGLTDRAEAAARQLELLLASLHDLPEAPGAERRRPSVVRHESARRAPAEVA